MIEKLNELTKEYLGKKAQQAQLKDDIESIGAEIKLIMGQEKMNTFESTYGDSVSYKEQTRRALDKKKVQDILSDEQFESAHSESTFETLRVLSKEAREKVKARLEKK